MMIANLYFNVNQLSYHFTLVSQFIIDSIVFIILILMMNWLLRIKHTIYSGRNI